MRHMIFTVEVTELVAGWRVEIEGDDDTSAALAAPSLDTALTMAVPFMAAVSNPDPLEAMFRMPPAQDGPPEGGGGV